MIDLEFEIGRKCALLPRKSQGIFDLTPLASPITSRTGSLN